jgi:TolA-binding protein
VWTPTVLILDQNGEERFRYEGYATKPEFRAQLELGLARVEFMNKHWDEAERRYGAIVDRYPDSEAAPEALYFRGFSHYKKTNDHTVLGELFQEFKKRYTDTIWAMKSVPWGHA